MNWDAFIEPFKNPFNIFLLVLIVIIFVLILILYVGRVKKSKYKKDKVAMVNLIEHESHETSLKIGSISKCIEEKDEFNKEAFKLINLKTDICNSFNSDYQEEIMDVLSLVPNKKVINAVNIIDKQWNQRKEELKRKIMTQYDEVVKQLEEKDLKIKEQKAQINEYEQMLKKSRPVKKVKIKVKKS